MAESLYASAVVNPLFQNAAKSAIFDSKDDDETIQSNASVYASNQNVLDITEEELEAMKKWSKILRIMMLIVATLMMITSYYNLSGSNSLSTNFLAVYVLFFSTLICCYEVAFQSISRMIVQNFGFMYNPIGRTIFLVLVAIMLFQLSTMGKVIFAFLLLSMLVQIYVDVKHKNFEKFVRLNHLHVKVATRAGASHA
jgi:hypothetical protein